MRRSLNEASFFQLRPMALQRRASCFGSRGSTGSHINRSTIGRDGWDSFPGMPFVKRRHELSDYRERVLGSRFGASRDRSGSHTNRRTSCRVPADAFGIGRRSCPSAQFPSSAHTAYHVLRFLPSAFFNLASNSNLGARDVEPLGDPPACSLRNPAVGAERRSAAWISSPCTTTPSPPRGRRGSLSRRSGRTDSSTRDARRFGL